jgi:hemerythrin-like domain-containing protein
MFEEVVESAKKALGKAEEKVREGIGNVEQKLRSDENPDQRPAQRGAPGDDDVLRLLMKDHELIESLFDQLEAVSAEVKDSELRDGLCAQLQYELESHADAEEKVFYPVMEREVNLRPQIAEARHEHALMRKLLHELEGMKGGGEGWTDKLDELRETVERHVDKEEGEIFPVAREALPEARLRKLGDELERVKATWTKEKRSAKGQREPSGKARDKSRGRTRQSSGKSSGKSAGRPSGKSTSTHKPGRTHVR